MEAMGHPGERDQICLLSDTNAADGAAMTFDRVLQRIAEATESIVIHMFVWRNDAIGRRIGRETLAAAERDVRIRILKDIGAFMYERNEMNRKSFFNLPVSAVKRLSHRLAGRTFPDTYVEDDFDDDLGRQVMAHENVSMTWVDHTHTKYYLFDDRFLITGSINIEDRHRGYRDYMVEISGASAIHRFKERRNGEAAFDAERSLEFVFNQIVDGRKRFAIKPAMLDLISRAERSLYIEMAYVGDPDLSREIIAAAKRGVRVTFLFSEEANVGDDLNYRSLFRICRKADISVVLSGKMIHSKLLLIDEELAILGSANLSVFSMRKAEEMDVLIRGHRTFLESLRQTIAQRLQQGRKLGAVRELAGYNKVKASLQQLHQWVH